MRLPRGVHVGEVLCMSNRCIPSIVLLLSSCSEARSTGAVDAAAVDARVADARAVDAATPDAQPPCALLFADDFAGPDGDSIGAAWTEFQGDLDRAGGRVVMSATATSNSWGIAAQSAVAGYTCARLRFAFRLGGDDNWVNVSFNGNESSLMQSGLGLFIYGDGQFHRDFIRLLEGPTVQAELHPAHLQSGVDYFVTLEIHEQVAAFTLRTGGHDGPIVGQLGAIALQGTERATGVQIGLDHNNGASPALDEVRLEASPAVGAPEAARRSARLGSAGLR